MHRTGDICPSIKLGTSLTWEDEFLHTKLGTYVDQAEERSPSTTLGDGYLYITLWDEFLWTDFHHVTSGMDFAILWTDSYQSHHQG